MQDPLHGIDRKRMLVLITLSILAIAAGVAALVFAACPAGAATLPAEIVQASCGEICNQHCGWLRRNRNFPQWKYRKCIRKCRRFFCRNDRKRYGKCERQAILGAECRAYCFRKAAEFNWDEWRLQQCLRDCRPGHSAQRHDTRAECEARGPRWHWVWKNDGPRCVRRWGRGPAEKDCGLGAQYSCGVDGCGCSRDRRYIRRHRQ